MWHHFSSLYGKQIKYLFFQKIKKKTAFGKPFFSIVVLLELRLNILLVRMRFTTKVLEANALIAQRLVEVNGFFKQKNYLARKQDIVRSNPINLKGIAKRFFLKKWRLFL